jgi:uncharacterized protein (TIGR02145 family)
MQLRRIILALTFCLGLTGLSAQTQTVKDADGNVYPVISIGKQTWMGENLRTTTFNDNNKIPYVTDNKAWKDARKPAYCWYENDIKNKEDYGALYNWFTVDTKKVCPKGWHVPTDADWSVLTTFIGEKNNIADKLKETGSDHWDNTLSNATDEYGFTALPGGFRQYAGPFPTFGRSYSVWWTATAYDAVQSWTRGLYFSSSGVYRGHDFKQSGFSIRCLKDN